MHEADLLCAQLASCGIDAEVPDQNTATVLPLYGGALGGIRIQVKESDLERAREVMREMVHVPEKQDLKCPACRSAKVDYGRVAWPFYALVVLLFGIPLLWLRKKYTCLSCGHHWKEPDSARQ